MSVNDQSTDPMKDPVPPMTSPSDDTVVFIANRGEIAVRVIRAARDLGLRTAVVNVAADASSPYVELADRVEAVPATPNPFLDAELLVAAAVRAHAQLVHPGYGFLAEDAEFARRVQAAGLTWVGPDPEAITLLGDKVSARAIALAVGAPLARGSDGPVADAEGIRSFAADAGYPVAVKASHGGGGRGMRVVRSEEEAEPMLAAARAEALAAFGDDQCFVEQYLDRPRHVETQCLADAHGNVSIVSTRDCSLQRRHQKLLEEAPAPGLTAEQLDELTRSSRDILRRVGYRGAATCEFLVSREGAISFLEVNTRIQVEHTVTEEVSGIDLIEQQFRIARGEVVSFPDNQVQGCAIEFRINSEDPALGFLPSTGTISDYTEPAGPWVRVDSGVRAGSRVSASFDSMLAKLIVTGPTRTMALDRARRALCEYVVRGVSTTLPLFGALIEDAAVRRHGLTGDGIYTNWLEEEFLPGGGLERLETASPAPHPAPDGSAVGASRMTIRVDGREMVVEIPDALLARLGTRRSGTSGNAPRIEGINVRESAAGVSTGRAVVAPIQGTVVAVHVEEGREVAEGDPLVTLEVMKMEHLVKAPVAGRVRDLVSVGELISPPTPVLRLL